MIALRDQVMAALKHHPMKAEDIARVTAVAPERVQVCIGALERDGKIVPTRHGWEPRQKAHKPRQTVRPLAYDRVTPTLAIAAVDGLVRLRVSGAHGGTVPLLPPQDILAAANWLREVGLDGSAAS